MDSGIQHNLCFLENICSVQDSINSGRQHKQFIGKASMKTGPKTGKAWQLCYNNTNWQKLFIMMI